MAKGLKRNDVVVRDLGHDTFMVHARPSDHGVGPGVKATLDDLRDAVRSIYESANPRD